MLESDTDEQLLIHINFSQAVRLSGIVIKSSVGDAAPKTVKLFVNQPTIGFSGEFSFGYLFEHASLHQCTPQSHPFHVPSTQRPKVLLARRVSS